MGEQSLGRPKVTGRGHFSRVISGLLIIGRLIEGGLLIV